MLVNGILCATVRLKPDEPHVIEIIDQRKLPWALRVVTVRLFPDASPAANHAFDVTPARLVTGLITERGVCAADEAALWALYPGS